MKKVYLEAFTKKPNNKWFNLKDCIYEYKKNLVDEDGEVSNLLNSLDKIAEKQRREWLDAVEQRFEQWEALIGKYLKVTVLGTNDDIYDMFYLFPYKLIRANHCLFALMSPIHDSYNGGIFSKTYDVLDISSFTTSKLEIEEVDRDKMFTNAVTTITNVINTRLEKMNAPEQKVNITWEG